MKLVLILVVSLLFTQSVLANTLTVEIIHEENSTNFQDYKQNRDALSEVLTNYYYKSKFQHWVGEKTYFGSLECVRLKNKSSLNLFIQDIEKLRSNLVGQATLEVLKSSNCMN